METQTPQDEARYTVMRQPFVADLHYALKQLDWRGRPRGGVDLDILFRSHDMPVPQEILLSVPATPH